VANQKFYNVTYLSDVNKPQCQTALLHHPCVRNHSKYS